MANTTAIVMENKASIGYGENNAVVMHVNDPEPVQSPQEIHQVLKRRLSAHSTGVVKISES